MGLFSNIWNKPKQKASALYGSNPVRVLPRGTDALAGGFPEWLDPVTMELDRKAYTVLRRADAVAFPMEKLATLLATRKLTVVCQENPNFAKDVQRYCVDHILGATDAIKWLSWGIIEGVRFMFVDAYAVRDWYVPMLRGGGEKKVKADGLITWDGGENIVSRRQLVGGAITPLEDAEAKQFERYRWMVYRPGAGSSPEGDTDLAYRLYRIAYQSLELDKAWAAYAERYGLPVPVFKEMVRLGASDEASQAMSDGARKAALLKRGAAIGLTADQALDFINPDGTAWGFLIEASREYEARAHKAILLNTTSSAPQSVGPDQRGSSDIHKSEEELAVESLALSMKDTCLRDLQRFIEVANSERLREIARANSETPNIVRIPNWHIELQPSVIERENNATDVLAYYNAGVPINANELYGPAGLTVPEGSEDIITKKEPDPFGGFGGGFGGGALPQRTQLAFNSPVEELALSPAPFAQEALPPSSLQVTPEPQPEPVKSPPAHMDRLEERADIDELYDAEGLRTEFQDEMSKALFAVAEQLEQGKASPKLPESVLMMIAKTSALAELAGRAEAQTSLNERYLGNQSDAVVSLAAERAKLSRWITIGGGEDEDGKRTGGRRVQISDEGVIEKGLSKNAQGKTLKKAFNDPEDTFETPRNAEADPDQKRKGEQPEPPAKPDAPKGRVNVKIVKETAKAYFIKDAEGREGWIQKRWLKDGHVSESVLEKAVTSNRDRKDSYAKQRAWKNEPQPATRTPDRETEKAIGFEIEIEIPSSASSRQGFRTKRMMWFPKSQAKQVDGSWAVPGWLIDARQDEIADGVAERYGGDSRFVGISGSPFDRSVQLSHEIEERIILQAMYEAERAKLSRVKLADEKDSGWRTLDNGTKIKIGDDGKIEAGPPNTQGKTLGKAFGGSKEEPSDSGSVGTLAAMIVQDLRDRNEYQDAAINDLPGREFLKDQINERREKLYSLAKEIMGSDDDDAADTLMAAVTINDRAGYNVSAPKLVEFAKEAAAEQLSPFADGFEDRMIERFNLSALNERVKLAEVWRTIGAQDGKGGTPVQIDTDTGEIKSGPKNLEGRSVQSISESQRDKRGPEGDSPLEVIGGAVASTYEAVQDALASDTVQDFLSTVFVPNRFVWQGKQLWDRFWRETGDTGHVGDDDDSKSAWRFLWQGGG